MPSGLFLSLLLHAGVIAIAYYGMPLLHRPPEILDAPIVVELALLADETNQPPPKPEPGKPKAEAPPPPPEEPKAVPPSPEPAKAEAAEPAPKPEPKPEPETIAKAPPPERKAPPSLADVKPSRKPKAPDRFASLLKNIDQDLKKRAPSPKELEKKEKTKEKNEDETFKELMENAMKSSSSRPSASVPVTISEIDLVRKQIQACWNIPAGAKDAEKLVIEIKVDMNQDGFVNHARIVDQLRMQTDKFFRIAAESALRATLNTRCQPFKLPPEKYEHWKEMTLNFNPKEML